MSHENDRRTRERMRARKAFLISVAVLVAVIAASALVLVKCTGTFNRPDPTPSVTPTDTDTDTSRVEEATEPPEPKLPENPIDFSKWMSENDDVYAYIYIPNTNVNYPILQSGVDDNYYLRRGLDKNYLLAGVIFTQSHNKKDFSDPVTLVYGHNMTEDGSMFATLHNFEDETFFNENRDVTVYTPGHILKYEVISAFKYDNRHIMNYFNFDDPAQKAEFFNTVLNPTAFPRNVREGAALSENDRLLVLSTCMSNNSYRYLVCCKFVSDTVTK